MTEDGGSSTGMQSLGARLNDLEERVAWLDDARLQEQAITAATGMAGLGGFTTFLLSGAYELTPLAGLDRLPFFIHDQAPEIAILLLVGCGAAALPASAYHYFIDSWRSCALAFLLGGYVLIAFASAYSVDLVVHQVFAAAFPWVLIVFATVLWAAFGVAAELLRWRPSKRHLPPHTDRRATDATNAFEGSATT